MWNGGVFKIKTHFLFPKIRPRYLGNGQTKPWFPPSSIAQEVVRTAEKEADARSGVGRGFCHALFLLLRAGLIEPVVEQQVPFAQVGIEGVHVLRRWPQAHAVPQLDVGFQMGGCEMAPDPLDGMDRAVRRAAVEYLGLDDGEPLDAHETSVGGQIAVASQRRPVGEFDLHDLVDVMDHQLHERHPE